MRGSGKIGMVVLVALMVTGALGLRLVGAAPVGFSPTPISGWSTNAPVHAVLIVGDTVYAGGDFTQLTGPGGTTAARSRLAAFDIHTGALRTGFSADTNGRVESLATDGTSLFVGGDYTTIKGVNKARLASLNLTTGNVNNGFTAGATSHVYALRVKGTRLYVGGAFSTLGGVARSRVGAVNTTTGAVDPSFNPNASDSVHGIVVSPDGNTVYVGGDFATIGGVARGNIAPVSSSTGALLPLAFQYPPSFTQIPTLIDLDLSPSGDRLFAGLGGDQNQALSWSTVTGRLQWSHQVDGDTQAVRYFNGNVYFGFHEGDLGDATVRMLAADATTGAVVTPYHLPIDSFFGVWDIDASPDALVLGGEFLNVNGVATQGVAILPRASNDAVAPTAPSNLRITGTTSTSITLAWNPGADDVGVAGYRVLRNGTEIAFPTDTSFTDTDLPASTDFTYEVQTVDAAGNFSPSVGPIPAGTDTTVVAAGSVWKYLDNGSNQGTAWRATAFNDTAWAAGPAQLGYGDGDEATVVSFGADPNNKYMTTYFRRQLNVDNPGALSNVNLTLLRDDGAVVYLNGVEIVRSNMPAGTITSATAAVTSIDGAGESQLYPFSVNPALFVAGTNTLAVEIHQAYRSSSDISFDLTLSTGRHPDNVAPSVPTGLAAPTLTGTSVGLTWTASTDNVGVTGYDVLRDGAVIGSPAAAAFTDSTVVGGQTYSYTVRARDLANNVSAESTALPVTPPAPDTTPPSIPANLHTIGLTPAAVTLAWNASTDASGVAGYDVLRDNVVIGSPTTTTFNDTTVAANQTYSYTVRARDAIGNTSADSTALSVTTPGDIVAPVTTDNTASVGNAWRTAAATVTLTPTDNLSGVAQTYYTTDGSTPTTASTTGTSFVLSASGTYTIRYFSVDVAGNVEAVKTAVTQIRIDTVAPTAVVTFPASGAFYNAARWNAGCATARICGTAADPLSGVASVGVTIQRSSDNRFWSGTTWQVASSTRPATGTATWYVPLATSALTNGVTYTVTARSVDAAGNTSAPVVSTFTYDTAAPATSSVAVTNHTGTVQTAVDTFTVTFGEALDPATVPATATLTLSRANGNTSYGISGLTNGLLTTGGNGYLTSSGSTRTVTYAGSLALSNSNRTVTFTVTGACAGSCTAVSSTAVSGRFVFTPATTLLDRAGNAATGSTTATNQVMF